MGPKKTQSLEVFAGANLCGNWNKPTAPEDVITSKSRTGLVIMYSGCTIIWVSKLQTQITLSTSKDKYIALSQSLLDLIPVILILQ